MKYFTESHEWIVVDGEQGTVGITEHAQAELGDIVFVELPEQGASVEAGEDCTVLESTKAAADVYSPVSGEVVAMNDQLSGSPELVNQSAEGEGWLFKVKLTAPDELSKLMTEEQYRELTAKA